jgi:hypothetical protein
MSSNDLVASQVVRRVLTKAMGDAAYRRTLLEHPNEVMQSELARSGAPLPDIRFDAVEETEKTWVLRVPVSESERRSQPELEPLFQFVDSASKADLDRFIRAPKAKLEELLGVEFQDDIDVVVRIEAQGERVLVVPQNEFGPISPDSDLPLKANKIKLCPKGHTLCPADCTLSSEICPAGCTFTQSCPCTISHTDTGDFCGIQKNLDDMARSPDASPQDSVKKLSDLLDE